MRKAGIRRRFGTVLGLAVCGITHQASADASGPSGGAAVTLDASRPGVAVIDNGIVRVTLDTDDAEIASIKYGSHEMVSTRGHAHVYFSRDGGGDYERLGHCRTKVVSRSDDGVDVSCRHVYDKAKDKHAWDVDVHFVVRRGVPGVYVYADVSHPADYPDLGIGEWRMVWSTPGGADEMDTVFVDDLRHWQVPAMADLAKAIPVNGGPKEVTELTSGDWKGRYDCKYMYSGQYWDMPCWGFASSTKKLGAWVVMPSHEWFNDGPNKQDLDCAVGTTLVHLNMNHYDGTGMHFARGQAWEKFYGPYLLYMNDKPTAEASWQDAKDRAAVEAEQWPFAWVKNDNYPLAGERGSVGGAFRIVDKLKPGLKADGAWIGLAAAESGPKSDFQFQSAGYQFWTHVNPGGTFTLANVRPGDYTLYAFATGATGQFAKAGVHVSGGAKVDLGTVTWDVPHEGTKLAWEIGTPDRSAAEFGHGQDYYLPMLFAKLPTEVPDPLDYTVGTSDPRQAWYYAQTRHATGDGNFAPQQWRVHFDLAQAPAGPATLVIAFAGADRARVRVSVNGDAGTEVVPPVQGGNGLVREAVHTKYSVVNVPIAPGKLKAGANTITFSQESVRDAASYVMYDAIRLELR